MEAEEEGEGDKQREDDEGEYCDALSLPSTLHRLCLDISNGSSLCNVLIVQILTSGIRAL